MFCPKCKKARGDGDVFCDQCGAKLKQSPDGHFFDLGKVFEKLGCQYQVDDSGNYIVRVQEAENADSQLIVLFSLNGGESDLNRLDAAIFLALAKDYISNNGSFDILEFCNEQNKSLAFGGVSFSLEECTIGAHFSLLLEKDASIELAREFVSESLSRLVGIYQEIAKRFAVV